MRSNVFKLAGVAILYRGTHQIINNSFIKLSEIEADFVNCVMLSNERTIDHPEKKWHYPNGNPVGCTSETEPFNCKLTDDRLGVKLYINPNLRGAKSMKKLFDPGHYSCCLPGKCDDGKSIRATLRIWGGLLHYEEILRTFMDD